MHLCQQQRYDSCRAHVAYMQYMQHAPWVGLRATSHGHAPASGYLGAGGDRAECPHTCNLDTMCNVCICYIRKPWFQHTHAPMMPTGSAIVADQCVLLSGVDGRRECGASGARTGDAPRAGPSLTWAVSSVASHPGGRSCCCVAWYGQVPAPCVVGAACMLACTWCLARWALCNDL
jgi:hypothetical protein